MPPQLPSNRAGKRAGAARQAMAGAHESITELLKIVPARGRQTEGTRRAAHFALTEMLARDARLLGYPAGNGAIVAAANRPGPHLRRIREASEGGCVQGSAGRQRQMDEADTKSKSVRVAQHPPGMFGSR